MSRRASVLAAVLMCFVSVLFVAQAAAAAERELVDRRTETSKTYVSDHGTFVTRAFAAPVHYRASDGSWREIDSTLVATADGYRNTAAGYSVLLPSRIEQAPVRIEADGKWVSYQLAGAAGSAQVNAARASYGQVLPGVDAVYDAQSGSVKETLVMASAQATREFAFDLAFTEGLSAQMRGAKTVEISDASGKVLFTLAAPFMQDADGKRSFAIDYTLERTATGARLTMKPDAAWLDRPERAWPVALDPTTYPGPDRDCTLNAGAPSTSACGASTLDAGSFAGSQRRSVLAFNVRQDLPKDAEILSASMSLYLQGQQTQTAKTVVAEPLTRTFDASATWNQAAAGVAWTSPGGDITTSSMPDNQPSVGGAGAAAGTRYAWDMRELVDRWFDGRLANHGIRLRTDGSTDNGLSFKASEAGFQAPVMDILWTHYLGAQRGFGLESFQLTDRLSLSVNTANGNLLVRQTDLTIPGGLGPNLELGRSFNSLSERGPMLGAGWQFDAARDVDLAPVQYTNHTADANTRLFNAPTGAKMVFSATGEANGKRSFKTDAGIDAKLEQDLTTKDLTLTANESQDKMVFSEFGVLQRQEDRNDRKIQYIHASGKLSQIIDARGKTTNFTYNTDGTLQKFTDPAGRIHAYDYTSGRLAGYTNPDGQRTAYTYTSGRLTQITTPAGRITRIAYHTTGDLTGRVSSVTRVTASTTDTDPTTSFDYTPGYTSSTARVTDPIGTSTASNATDRITSYDLDTRARVTKVTDPRGPDAAQSQTYTSTGNVETYFAPYNSSSAAGAVPSSKATFDANGNKTATEQLTGSTSSDPKLTTSATYGPTAVKGGTWLPQTQTDEQGKTTSLQYDANGNFKTSSRGASPTETRVTVNYFSGLPGKVQSTVDPNNNTTSYEYTVDGDLSKITPPSPQLGATTLSYAGSTSNAALGRVYQVTDGKGRTQTFTYDGSDRVKSVTFGDGGVVANTYDADGNLTTRDDTTHGQTLYSYDDLGRIDFEDYPGSVFNDYGYDLASNLKTHQTLDGTVSYGYDDINRQTSMTHPGVTGQTTYAYTDETSRNERKITLPSGVVTEEAYNKAGQMTKTCVRPGTATTACTTGSAADRLLSYSYSYLQSGQARALRQTETDKTGKQTAYTYDYLDRLTGATETGGTTNRTYAYEYDKASNTTKRTINGSVTSFAYNQANQLCWTAQGTPSTTPVSGGCATAPTGARTYAYDTSGNETSSSGPLRTASVYNARNQLTSVTSNGTAFTRAYAGIGQAERTQAGATAYEYSTLGLVKIGAQRIDRDEAKIPVLQRGTNGTRYLHRDALGSIRATSDAAGTVTARHDFDPYGNTTSTDTPGSATTQLGFAGGDTDGSELYHFGERYYAPETGRWTQQDPLNQATNLREANRYAYVGGDPVNLTDADGRAAFVPLLAAAAIRYGATKYVIRMQAPRYIERFSNSVARSEGAMPKPWISVVQEGGKALLGL